MAWTDYYKINTIDGDFFCYQEKQSSLHNSMPETNRKEMKEVFTNLRCKLKKGSICITSEPEKFKIIKPEIYRIRPDIMHLLEYKKIINYTYLTIGGNMLEYIIDPYIEGDDIENLFLNNIDDYKRINENDFKNEVLDYVKVSGNETKAQERILKRIENREKLLSKIEKVETI